MRSTTFCGDAPRTDKAPISKENSKEAVALFEKSVGARPAIGGRGSLVRRNTLAFPV